MDAVREQRGAGRDDDEGGDDVGEDGAGDRLAFLVRSSSSRTPRSTTADCRYSCMYGVIVVPAVAISSNR